ncbi:MAG TPA: EF-hand domain-containing protein, partial [Candidatus Thalassarchaeaceae archaeon]|nr:EF-hand domain-containing protein [Candidatus Thalassarchaeaceae archaeon]
MVSESDFIAAFQAYHDALEDPAAKVETIRPLVNQHLNELIARLPGVAVQNAARQRAMTELDRIEEMAKEKAVEVAEDIEEFEDEVKAKTQSLTPAAIFIEPENPAEGSPFTVGFSGSSGDPTAWIGIFSAGASHGEHGSNWLYVNGTTQPGEGKIAGSVTFTGEQYVAGDYDARLFRNNSHELMASATFTISPQFEVTEPEPKDSLQEAFNVFDRDGNGTIDLGELAHMMSALGENMSSEEVANLLNDYDTDGDGVINFEEFKVIMLTDRTPS